MKQNDIVLVQDSGAVSCDDQKEVEAELASYGVYWNDRQFTAVRRTFASQLICGKSGPWGELLVVKVAGLYVFNAYRPPGGASTSHRVLAGGTSPRGGCEWSTSTSCS